MIYEWKCDLCTARVEVTRSLADYDLPPTDDEASDAEKTAVGFLLSHDHEWHKLVSSSTSTPFENLRDKGVFERTHWKAGQK